MNENIKTVLSRRQLLGFGLVAPMTYGGRIPKNVQRKHRDEKLYHGPMRLPQWVVEMAGRGKLVRTTSRHSAIRCQDNDIVYVFRTFGGDTYLGEIVRGGQSGKLRVHVWSIIDCPDARLLADLIAFHAHGIDVRADQNNLGTDLDALTETIQ